MGCVPPETAKGSYTIGGTVAGLNGGEVGLLLDREDEADDQQKVVSADGAFEFDFAVIEGAAYSIVVQSSPIGASCEAVNGTDAGAVSATSPTAVEVVCTSLTLDDVIAGVVDTNLQACINAAYPDGTTPVANINSINCNFQTETLDPSGIEQFVALTSLALIWDAIIAPINTGPLVLLEELRIQVNQITTLDLSTNVNLTHLEAFCNQLTEINLENNPLLTSVDIGGNPWNVNCTPTPDFDGGDINTACALDYLNWKQSQGGYTNFSYMTAPVACP